MNQMQVIETLKRETPNNKTLSDTMLSFASRDRARHAVTLTGLMNRMKNEGFEHARDEYARVLQLLAHLGIGKLDVDPKGQIRALKDVRTTLQSIGEAALNEDGKLELAKRRNRFGRIDVTQIPMPAAPMPVLIVTPKPVAQAPAPRPIEATKPPKAPVFAETRSAEPLMVLAMLLKSGNLFKIQIPREFSNEDAVNIGRALLDLTQK